MEVGDCETRCAEVFITQEKSFSFHCCLCNDKSTDFAALLYHIANEHYADDSDSNGYIKIETVDILNGYDSEEIEWDEIIEEENCEVALDIEYKECGNFNDNPPETLEPSETQQTQDYTPIVPNSMVFIKRNGRRPALPGPFICEICNRQFKKMAYLRSHLVVHSDERKHKCDQCHMRFKTTSALYEHQRRHSDVKRHSCSHCPKKFYTSSELTIHIRTHTGERPYICPTCGKTYYSSGLLTEHMKRHNNHRPHKCDYCDKSFYNLPQKRIHQVSHTGERNFVCTKCNAAYGLSRSLAKHMLTHENSRKHKCYICQDGFNNKASLRSHLSRKHNVLGNSERMLTEPFSILDDSRNTTTEKLLTVS